MRGFFPFGKLRVRMTGEGKQRQEHRQRLAFPFGKLRVRMTGKQQRNGVVLRVGRATPFAVGSGR
jgi:hypothetical protein